MNISHSPPTVQSLVIPAYPYTRVLYLPVQEEEESAVVLQIEDKMDHEQVDRSLTERGRDEDIAVGDRQSEQSEMRDTFFEQSDTLKKSTLTEFQERERLRKLKIDEKMKEEVNVI